MMLGFFGVQLVKPCCYWQKINSHSGCGLFHHNKVNKLYKYKGTSVALKSSTKNVLKVL